MAVTALSGQRWQGSSTASTTEATYTTQCFDDNDDTADSDHIGY